MNEEKIKEIQYQTMALAKDLQENFAVTWKAEVDRFSLTGKKKEKIEMEIRKGSFLPSLKKD